MSLDFAHDTIAGAMAACGWAPLRLRAVCIEFQQVFDHECLCARFEIKDADDADADADAAWSPSQKWMGRRVVCTTRASVDSLCASSAAASSDIVSLAVVFNTGDYFGEEVVPFPQIPHAYSLTINAAAAAAAAAVQPLPSLRALSMYGSLISDVSTTVRGCSRLRTITLTDMPRVVDVSALGRVQSVTLASMPSVVDVSALGNVRALTLVDMPGVVDVAALGNVRDLILFGIDNVVDVSVLGSVHALVINHARSVVGDVAALSGVHSLCIQNCGDMPVVHRGRFSCMI